MNGSPNDDTACLRMKRDFNAFIQGDDSRRTNLSKHGLRFSLDRSISQASISPTSVSMQSLLEKEREEKLRRVEIISAKAQINKLEQQVAQLETSNKRARIEYERDHEIDQLLEYKERWQYHMEKEQLSRVECVETKHEMATLKNTLEQKISELQKDKIQLEEELRQCQESSHMKITEMKNELWRQTADLGTYKNQMEEAKSQLKLQLRRTSEIAAHVKELEIYKIETQGIEQKVKNLEETLRSVEDDSILVNSMKSQLSTLPDLEKEVWKLKEDNQYLRETQENCGLIQEQMESYRGKLERADKRCVDMATLQVQNEELMKRIQKWELNDCSDTGQLSPVELRRQVAELQNSQVLYLEKQGQLQSRIRSLEDSLQRKEEHNRSSSSLLSQESNRASQQAELIKRLQKKLLIVAKERDAFKRILDSYESEMTVKVDVHTSSRIAQQEETIHIYQRQLEQLETDLEKQGIQLNQERMKTQQLEFRLEDFPNRDLRTPHDAVADQKTIFQLKTRIAELETRLDKTEEEKYILETRIEQRHLQGDYDPTKTKVVHFHMNPVALVQKQRGEELQHLREENEKLKERVKLLQESGGRVEDLTVMVEQKVHDSPAETIDELKSQVSSAVLKNKRLMEVFKKTSQEFREVCYQLIGYKIDIYNTNQYRLTSMYAESPADYLIFTQRSSGEVQLLATDYSTSLTSLTELYLQQQDSIPAFLSAITLDLFARQTMKL